ncbi:DeoR/GlpR family transcriptional regulator of sugar metabolism [Gracilibacillus halotolerans]|uniref:DeoR/GlpR family transcriptional regulator of sugar metabolism n=1 Tax=Gracilibacillus halotolerans TaxID=74386 RepID=A0A841RM59_9BACI|nr:DeoR/GlpR family transcriptional regulator of sugar metabolism [Gracilibacillus halotolerans]
MLVAERHKKIVEIVNERKSVRVTELAKMFSVTDETIRRDLEKLERESKIVRSHGGAISLEQQGDGLDLPVHEREIMFVEEKKQIAAEAVKHIAENDKILLDASTTAWYVARNLPNIPLTVLTNSVKVILELSQKSNITVISIGGNVQNRSLSYVGPLAEKYLDNYHVNKAFLSCKGIHLERGISESNEQQARVKQKMLEIADVTYIMANHQKFGVQAFTHVASLATIDRLITNSKLPSEIVNGLKEVNIEVFEA